MPRVGFEPTILVLEGVNMVYTLDRVGTKIFYDV
jgi:hypothetical protein